MSCSAAVIALGIGCAGSFPPTDAARAASFQAVATTRIGGEDAMQFLRERTARVFSGAKFDAFEDTSSGGVPSAKWHVAPSPNGYGVGTATPVDARGYFLTASHCIGPKPITLFYWDVGSGGEKSAHVVLVKEPRVIWQGNFKKHEPDIAVLCVDRPLAHFLTWAPTFKDSDIVMAAGVNFTTNGMRPAFLAGKVRTSAEDHGPAGPSWVEILHDAPVHEGDSGGPLVTLDGELLGITTGGVSGPLTWVGFPHGGADRPNLDWLRRLIDEDAARGQGR